MFTYLTYLSMRKTTVGLGIIVIIAIGVLGIYRQQIQPESKIPQTPLRIGLNPWIGNGLYAVAEEKGFFIKEGIRVELVNYDDGATGKQLLSTKHVDALSLTPETVIILADAGTSVRAVAMTDTSLGADGIIATKNIQNVRDLRGKKVAFEVGSPSHLFLSYLLDQQGMTTNDLMVIDSAAPDAGVAFVSGQVDAAVTWEPWLSKANERSGGHLIANSKDTPILPALLVFRDETIQTRQGDIQALLRALFAAQVYTQEHQAETVSIVAKHFNINNQDVLDQLPTFRWLSYTDNERDFATGTYSATSLIARSGDLWLKLGLIKKPINASTLVDPSLLNDLYKK